MKPSNNKLGDILSPGDFPVGSPESRAAARAMLEDKTLTQAEIDARIVEILNQGRARAPARAAEPNHKKKTTEEIMEEGRRLRELLRRHETR